MKSKSELRDLLQRARSDTALRASLLGDARFSKKLFGWLALATAALALVSLGLALNSPGGLSSFLSHEGIAWGNFILTAMLYDKFADRVATLESMEEQSNQPPELTSLAGAAHL